MAVVINRSSDEVYMGHLKAAAQVAPGCAVVADFSAGTAAAPASDAAADGYGVYLVANYDPYADTDATNSADFTVAQGAYLRLKKLHAGDIFTTDQFVGDYATIAVGNVFAVNGTAASGAVGKWIAVGTRTPVVRVQVIEKTTLYGNNALKFVVL
jgi:hypothetical protein